MHYDVEIPLQPRKYFCQILVYEHYWGCHLVVRYISIDRMTNTHPILILSIRWPFICYTILPTTVFDTSNVFFNITKEVLSFLEFAVHKIWDYRENLLCWFSQQLHVLKFTTKSLNQMIVLVSVLSEVPVLLAYHFEICFVHNFLHRNH